MIKIAIVDDHQIVIDGLKLLLSRQPEVKVVADATSGPLMIKKLVDTPTDVLLVDVMMPEMDGYELAVLIRQSYPEMKIIALSMNADGAYVNKMIAHAQINGYVLKTADKNELKRAITTVVNGDNYFSEEILKELQVYERLKQQNAQLNLTTRELEIVKYIIDGRTNKQIAEQLFISEYTVETHRKNIFRKTNTHSAVSLAEYVRKQKIV